MRAGRTADGPTELKARRQLTAAQSLVKQRHGAALQGRLGCIGQVAGELHLPGPGAAAGTDHAVAAAQQTIELALQFGSAEAFATERCGCAQAAEAVGPGQHHLTTSRGGQGQLLPGIANSTDGLLLKPGHRRRCGVDRGAEARDRPQAFSRAKADRVALGVDVAHHVDGNAAGAEVQGGAALQGGGLERRFDAGSVGADRNRGGLEAARTRQRGAGAHRQVGRRCQLGRDGRTEGLHRHPQGRTAKAESPLVGGAVVADADRATRRAKTAAAAIAGRGGQQCRLQGFRRTLQIDRRGAVGDAAVAAAEREAQLHRAADAGGKPIEAMHRPACRVGRCAVGRPDGGQAVIDAAGDAAVAGLQGSKRSHLGGDAVGKANAIQLGIAGRAQLLHGDGVGTHLLDHRTGAVDPGAGGTRGQQLGQGFKQLARLGVLGAGEHGGGRARAIGKAQGDAVAVAGEGPRYGDRQVVGRRDAGAGGGSLALETAADRCWQARRPIGRSLHPQTTSAGRAGQPDALARKAIDQTDHKTAAAAAGDPHIGTAQQLLECRLQVGCQLGVAKWGAAQIGAVRTGPLAVVAEAPTALAEAAVAVGSQQELGVDRALHVEPEAEGARRAAGQGRQLHTAARTDTAGARAGHAAGGRHHVDLPSAEAGRWIGRGLHHQIAEALARLRAAQAEREAGAAAAADRHAAAAIQLLEPQIEGRDECRIAERGPTSRQGRHRHCLAASAAEAVAALAEAAAIGTGRRQQPAAAAGRATGRECAGTALTGADADAGLPNHRRAAAGLALDRKIAAELAETRHAQHQVIAGQAPVAAAAELGFKRAAGAQAADPLDCRSAPQHTAALVGAVGVGDGVTAKPEVTTAIGQGNAGAAGGQAQAHVRHGQLPGLVVRIAAGRDLLQQELALFLDAAPIGGSQVAKGVAAVVGVDRDVAPIATGVVEKDPGVVGRQVQAFGQGGGKVAAPLKRQTGGVGHQAKLDVANPQRHPTGGHLGAGVVGDRQQLAVTAVKAEFACDAEATAQGQVDIAAEAEARQHQPTQIQVEFKARQLQLGQQPQQVRQGEVGPVDLEIGEGQSQVLPGQIRPAQGRHLGQRRHREAQPRQVELRQRQHQLRQAQVAPVEAQVGEGHPQVSQAQLGQ